jgi:pyruvate/2-oxoglutarate dehydrogenase complex dihydrolipoamide acyltransferase (E2) component
MPFIFKAVTDAIRKFPAFNSQVSGDQIVYKRDINLGMAVALDWGLIVPVIKRADDLSISGLARAANDLADRARTKQLKPDEVAGGTFTITNPGVFGGLFGTPIINQPQVQFWVSADRKRAQIPDYHRRCSDSAGLFCAQLRSSVSSTARTLQEISRLYQRTT